MLRLTNGGRCAVLVAMLFALGFTSSARAETIFTSADFSGTFEMMGVQPFNTSLGTLDRVDVQIDGFVVATGSALGGNIVRVEQNFFGLGGKFFEFGSNAVMFQEVVPFTFTSEGVSVPTPYVFATSYQIAFHFDATTDLLGFALPSFSGIVTPPITIVGNRSRFLDSFGPPHNEIDMVLSSTGTTVPAMDSGGAVLITYTYTPHPPIVPLPPAVSAGAVLMGLAVATRVRSMRRVRAT